MAYLFLHSHGTIKATTIFFFFLATTFMIANSARILDEVDTQEPQVIGNLPLPGAATTTIPVATPQIPVTTPQIPVTTPQIPVTTSQVGPAATLPSGQTPATAANLDSGGEEADAGSSPVPEAEAPEAVPVTAPVDDDVPVPPPVAIPQQPEAEVPVPAITDETAAGAVGKEPSLSFFMHDIVGGSHPSARVVAGIVANTDVTGLPFSKLNNNIFPISGGIPLVNPKLNGIITNNNLPNLVGLNAAQSSTVFQNRGTSNVVSGGNNQPFVSAGNLPSGFTLQKLMFGTVTVIDDQITEGHELDSAVVGRVQGFYLASSLDGTSQSVVLTVLLHQGGEHHEGVVDDSISLFGVHRTASPNSEVAVIGGTGKYENARGYAALETLLKEDQHTTDGVDTILHFNIYLTHY